MLEECSSGSSGSGSSYRLRLLKLIYIHCIKVIRLCHENISQQKNYLILSSNENLNPWR